MTPSPSIPFNSGTISYSILINGNPISALYTISSILIEEPFHKIPFAHLVLLDGSASDQNFKINNEGIFNPGNNIEILLGHHGINEMIFKGIIISNNHKLNDHCSEVNIECKDERVKMTLSKSGGYYYNITDADIVNQLLLKYGFPEVEWPNGQKISHEQLVQYDATDWDYMISRIDLNGKIGLIHNGKFLIKTPNLKEDPILTLTYGSNILEFNADIDSRIQSESVKSISWDYEDQDLRILDSEDPEGMELNTNPEERGSKTIREAVNNFSSIYDQPFFIRSGYLSQIEQQTVSNSKKLKQILARLKGTVKFYGSEKVLPGSFIQLQGLGDSFNGNAFVSAIKHEFSEGGWTTEATLGVDENFFTQNINPHHPATTAGQLSSIQGLHIGIITDLVDPSGQFRIKVKLPLVDVGDDGVYARIATLDAGNNRGTFFRPELNDEVLVGFMNDDPRHPVILGMLHSSNKAAPLEPKNDNHKKGYVSRSGIKMLFDDEKKSLLIETPESRIVELDDVAGTISIKDPNGNKIIMDSNGITIESVKDLSIKAGKSISLSAPTISMKADATLSLEGTGSTSVKSGGVTEIKGSLVKIN